MLQAFNGGSVYAYQGSLVINDTLFNHSSASTGGVSPVHNSLSVGLPWSADYPSFCCQAVFTEGPCALNITGGEFFDNTVRCNPTPHSIPLAPLFGLIQCPDLVDFCLCLRCCVNCRRRLVVPCTPAIAPPFS